MNQQLVGEQWYQVLKDEFDNEYITNLKRELNKEYQTYKVYPKPTDIFRAFQLTPFDKVKVIMLGQDPYPFGQADGLAFSTHVKETPFSLQRIFRELDRDLIRTKDFVEYSRAFPTNDLSSWAKQGVLLLNPVLTVRSGESGSHRHLGWQQFTTRVMEILAVDPRPKVFVLLGKEAQDFMMPVVFKYPNAEHLIITSGHPASGAHGRDKFSGCGMFSKISRYFKLKEIEQVNWKLNGN